MLEVRFKGILKLFAGLVLAPIVIKSSNSYNNKSDNNCYIGLVCHDVHEFVYGNSNPIVSSIFSDYEDNLE